MADGGTSRFVGTKEDSGASENVLIDLRPNLRRQLVQEGRVVGIVGRPVTFSNQLTRHHRSPISREIRTLALREEAVQEASSVDLDYCCNAVAWVQACSMTYNT